MVLRLSKLKNIREAVRGHEETIHILFYFSAYISGKEDFPTNVTESLKSWLLPVTQNFKFACCLKLFKLLHDFPLYPGGFPGGWAGKESACEAGDLGLIPGLGRYPGEGKGSPLQYSGLENSRDCIRKEPDTTKWLSLSFHCSDVILNFMTFQKFALYGYHTVAYT